MFPRALLFLAAVTLTEACSAVAPGPEPSARSTVVARATAEPVESVLPSEAPDVVPAPPAEVPTEVPTAAPEAVDGADPPAEGGMPESVTSIRALLGARDSRDLPTRRVLDRHEAAAASLHWLAQHDERPRIRGRAADRLGLFPGTQDHLMAIITDETETEAVRAGAVLGLGRTDLAGSPHAADFLLAQLKSTSLRVALEAATVVAHEPALAERAAPLATDETVAAPVRSILEKAVGRELSPGD